MLAFVAFLKGEEKISDISFQVSTPLNNQQERGSYSSKGKSFHWDKQSSQTASPISQHPENENAYAAASPVSDRTQLLSNNRPTAVQLLAFTSSLWGLLTAKLAYCTEAHNTARERCFEKFRGFISA